MIFAAILIGLSYKKERIHLFKYAFIIVTARNSLRLYNFEKSESNFALDVVQSLLCLVMNQMFDFSFRVTRVNYYIGSFQALFSAIGLAGLAMVNFEL